MSGSIVQTVEESVLYLELNRSNKKNALTRTMYQQLTRLLAEADADPGIRVVHLTGSGDSFCAGNDIADFMAASQAGEMDAPALDFLKQLHAQRKPIVVAVNGIAVGIGVTLLLHCDFVYAAEGAGFRLPFVDLGLVPEGGSSALLPRLLGHRKAAELLLACEPFDALTAERYGIINRVYPADRLLAESKAMASRLALKPAAALLQAKAMLKNNPERSLERVIPAEVELFMKHLNSEETVHRLHALFGV